MSVSIKYKGAEIASASTNVTKTIKTSGKYCEGDIEVINTPDGGDAPVINPLSVTANGTYTAPSGVDGYSPVTVNVPQGITPSGNINITDTNVTDVTNYATATIVDADLVASNIKKDVNILGVVGTFEGGGGSLPPSISKLDGGSFTLTTETIVTLKIEHNLGVVPRGVAVWVEDETMGQSVYGGALIRFNSTGALDAPMRSIVYRSGAAAAVNSAMQTSTSSNLTDTDWTFNHGAYKYQAGKTYKWIAWA